MIILFEYGLNSEMFYNNGESPELRLGLFEQKFFFNHVIYCEMFRLLFHNYVNSLRIANVTHLYRVTLIHRNRVIYHIDSGMLQGESFH